MNGQAAAAGVLQLTFIDVEEHAGDEGKLAETQRKEVVVVAAEEHGGRDDRAFALEVDWMVGEHKGLDYISRLARFKRGGNDH